MGDLRDTVRLDLADLGLCIRVLLGGRHLQGRSGGGRREEPGERLVCFWSGAGPGGHPGRAGLPDRHGSVTIIKKRSR